MTIPNTRTPLLDGVDTPADLRKLDKSQLRQFAAELRTDLIDIVAVTGGHLGAGLGVVELTTALHYVFNTPDDKIIWDVGHQAYPHKITTGLGYAVAASMKGEKRNVVAVIGDGAMSAGMAYEAMNNAGAMDARLIVILNDNDMSIAPPVGAMSAYLARLISGRTYRSLREIGKQFAKRLPKVVENHAVKAEEFARGLLAGGTLFEELGFYYVGPIDGHNLDHLLPVLQNVRDAKEGPILVHVVTQKGKGYAPAEASSDKYHGVVKFDIATGKQAKAKANAPSYTKVLGESLVKEAQKDDRIVAIT